MLALPPPPSSLLPPTSSLPLLPTVDQICSDSDACVWTSSLPYSPRHPLCPPTPRQPRRGRSKRPAPPPPPPSTPLPPLPKTLGFSASSRFLDNCRTETFSECLESLSLPSCQCCPSKPSCPDYKWTFLLLLMLLVVGLGLGLGFGLKGESEQVSASFGTSQALLLLGGTDGTSNRTLQLVSGGT